MKDMMLKMLFSIGILVNSTLHNIIKLIDLNMEMDVILNMKLLNIEIMIVIYQQKDTVSLNVLIS